MTIWPRSGDHEYSTQASNPFVDEVDNGGRFGTGAEDLPDAGLFEKIDVLERDDAPAVPS